MRRFCKLYEMPSSKINNQLRRELSSFYSPGRSRKRVAESHVPMSQAHAYEPVPTGYTTEDWPVTHSNPREIHAREAYYIPHQQGAGLGEEMTD